MVSLFPLGFHHLSLNQDLHPEFDGRLPVLGRDVRLTRAGRDRLEDLEGGGARLGPGDSLLSPRPG